MIPNFYFVKKGKHMRKLIKYECEMCKKLFDSTEEAIACESRGKEMPLVNVGQKILYRDDWNGGFGTCYDELYVTEVKDYGHYISYSLGSENGVPYQFISGNKEFNDLCQIL